MNCIHNDLDVIGSESQKVGLAWSAVSERPLQGNVFGVLDAFHLAYRVYQRVEVYVGV